VEANSSSELRSITAETQSLITTENTLFPSGNQHVSWAPNRFALIAATRQHATADSDQMWTDLAASARGEWAAENPY